MAYEEYKNIKKGSASAYLFIHGIAGTPDHFRSMIPLLPDDADAWNLLLEGHGKGPRDFSSASMKKWEEQVRCAVEELAETHERIYIVAHSMGTLLAIEQALRCEKVAGLFLMAVPLRIALKKRMFSNSVKIFLGKGSADDPWFSAAKVCYGICSDKNPFHYIGWIPRYLELFRKIRKTRKLLPFLSCPCVVFQSALDEMVSDRSMHDLRELPCATRSVLKNSGHCYYPEEDLQILLKSFSDWITEQKR